MLDWFKEAALLTRRIPTPPLFRKKVRRELEENFRWIDRERKGYITYNDLVDSELVDGETATALMARYDVDNSGTLTCDEFLELLCPNGYRAHPQAVRAVDLDGRVL